MMLREASPYGDLARPERLPKPNCRVKLICGPPAAGKSSYVAKHAKPGDSVIDIDGIAKEFGLTRDRPPEATSMLLGERNGRLAKLGKASRSHTAWVIIGAPSPKLRAWWCDRLGVRQGDLVLLTPPRAELLRRIARDPDRRGVIELHTRLIDQWFSRERENKAGRIVPGCDANGWPKDPLHSWND
jgi:5-methylcytosine-specific restriction protein A